ncbi:hypothetical protein N7478_006410 [Penicillium angulare]|uniref:uncharacterized protein n=1 Tax=Penicillium angulare TaxID=116970 RepID=UPI00254082ED|nr:uncharacterized protein N7478_006410 [Penicillium angulare]KAJ5281038.1 hypothetical protein N7478_006410 [Penicillium angulare]
MGNALIDALEQASSKSSGEEGESLSSFLASLATSIVIFAVEFFVFLALKDKLTRIYQPRTYLVSDRERTAPSPPGIFRWIAPVFQTSDAELIQRSGLDAYFFLRYLRMLLKIFVPLALLLIPVLIPVNYAGGKGTTLIDVSTNSTARYTVTGLDKLAWGNIKPTQTHRYWAHLILAIIAIIYICFTFFYELRVYIRMRQAYMTSPQHRLRASATTLLVTAIPQEWLSYDALNGLFDVFPGGVRNIWVNRNFDELNDKVKRRRKVALKLEAAETSLVRKCKEAQVKKLETERKKEKKQTKGNASAQDQEQQTVPEKSSPQTLMGPGVSSGNPHQAHTLAEVLHRQPEENQRHGTLNRVPHKVFDPAKAAAGAVTQGVGAVTQGVGKLGKSVLGGLRKVEDVIEHKPTQTGGNVDNPASERTNDQTIPTYCGPDEQSHLPRSSDQGSILQDKLEEEGEKNQQQSHPDELINTESDGPYPIAYNEGYEDTEQGEPLWKKYIEPKDRDTWRLPWFKWNPWPTIWLIGKKVDTIDYCRKELARLNMEIETDQEHPERFPLMNSAFIQFNHQVAAHMACQSVTHYLPKHMAPRIVEISPDDVIWDNMSLKWWERYLRTFAVVTVICAMIVTWAIPVAFTGLLSQLSYLEDTFYWLAWLGKLPSWLISAIQGILPTAFLAILMAILPAILRFLSKQQGVFNGMGVEMTVQSYFFAFLFVQIFVVVTISSSLASILQGAGDVSSWPKLLASDVPKASNYFFSYMLLRAMSVSAGALMQVVSLIKWFILGPILDNTARSKWNRTTNLIHVKWGSFFPIYTTLAAVGMIYCIVAPLILIFNIITFSAFWFTYRYRTLYVAKFRFDTGGLLFPRAINQLFTGLYVMEIALIVLFFLVRDADDKVSCKGQAIIMIFVLVMTIGYQFLLSEAFGPLIRYLPVALENEAIKQDEEFHRAQAARLTAAIDESDDENDDDHTDDDFAHNDINKPHQEKDIELEDLGTGDETHNDPSKTLGIRPRGWTAAWHPNPIRVNSATPSSVVSSLRGRMAQDTESQEHFPHNMGNLFSGVNDELEDLTPKERDELVQRAFQHEALRAKRPVVWIPRDDLGVSDDEIYRTQQFSKHIWVSNEYQTLDEKGKTIFSRRPPDFSDLELIQL